MGGRGDAVTIAAPMSMRRPPNPVPFQPRERRSRKARWGSGARGVGTERDRRSRAGSTLTAVAPRRGPGVGRWASGVGKNQGWPGSRPAPPSRGGRGWCVTYTRRLPSTQDIQLSCRAARTALHQRSAPEGAAHRIRAEYFRLRSAGQRVPPWHRAQSHIPVHPQWPLATRPEVVCHTPVTGKDTPQAGAVKRERRAMSKCCAENFCLLKQTIVCYKRRLRMGPSGMPALCPCPPRPSLVSWCLGGEGSFGSGSIRWHSNPVARSGSSPVASRNRPDRAWRRPEHVPRSSPRAGPLTHSSAQLSTARPDRLLGALPPTVE
jgi:hypothetical protein